MRVRGHISQFLAGRAVLTLLAVAAAQPLFADVKLAPIFGDNMVIQQNKPVSVRGTAVKGESVTVKFGGQEKTVTADENGNWLLKLDALKASAEPAGMTVAGANTIVLKNVVVGEVWLCSGQSNMAWPVSKVTNAKQETEAADFPLIRLNGGSWQECGPKTVGRFSGTAYFFGRHLHRELKAPIGLINRSRGGTPIEYWTPHEELMKVPYAKEMYEKCNSEAAKAEMAERQKALQKWRQELQAWRKAKKEGRAAGKPPARPAGGPGIEHGVYAGDRPGNLYRAHIVPLIPFTIRGVIWYQGERNARVPGGSLAYRDLLPNMIRSWREAFVQRELPFLFVQLPDNAGGQTWELIRESMLRSLKVPNTGMAITMGIGGSLHPANKQDVGMRLALAALKIAYERDLVCSGPIPDQTKIAGGEIHVTFKHVGSGLAAKGDKLTGFEIAGEDKQFVTAVAKIEGPTVIVSSDQVAGPVAVRYAWAPAPKCNLYNKEGLPASPFRTDDWE